MQSVYDWYSASSQFSQSLKGWKDDSHLVSCGEIYFLRQMILLAPI